MPKKKVTVIGAGVSGLSSGILLLKAGFDVQIWAKAFSPHTTSDTAGAFWEPFKAGPREKVALWAKQTLDYSFANLVSTPASGCSKLQFQGLAKDAHAELWWGYLIDDLKHATDNLPTGYNDSIIFTTVVFDTSIYMKYLRTEFERLGGKLVKRTVSSIAEPFQKAEIVVNCTGLGSGQLFDDKSLTPSRGQTVVVKAKES